MAEIIRRFIEKVLLIKSTNPKRREPGDGSDGYCDCIGLIIGAIRRMGLKWTGIHGSNWAARKEFVELKKINSVNDLSVGDVVLRGCPPGTKGWALPSRYRQGGKYYNGDLTDYYHAGVVTHVNPLNITHMSSKMTVDTKLGKWNYYGTLSILAKAAGGITPKPVPVDPTDPASGSEAVVVAKSGGTVNLRIQPSKAKRIITRVPLGRRVKIITPGEEWCYVTYNQFTGYMMAEFLDVVGDGRGKY